MGMRKLTVSLILAMLLAVMGLGWGIDQLFDHLSPQSSSDTLEIYENLGNGLVKTLEGVDQPREFVSQWNSNSNISLSLIEMANLALPAALMNTLELGKPLILGSEKTLSLYFLMPAQQQALSLTVPSRPSPESSLHLALTLLFYVGLVLLIFLWMYPLIKRLLRLRETAKQFGEGALDQRIPTGAMSYITDIEVEFNRMAQRIQTLVEDNKLLGSAVSHDLRTPLARLRFGIEALIATDIPENKIKYEAHISRDIDQMESLVEVLLNYARLEQSMIVLQKRPINLPELISDCVETTGLMGKNISWQPPSTEHPESVVVDGDESYLSILINNLLENAIRYSDGQISVSLHQSQRQCQLMIEDDGPGIPAEQQQRLFKPFMRGQNNKAHKGFGMGLAIVSRIADWHGGQIHMSNSPTLGGLCISIAFDRPPD